MDELQAWVSSRETNCVIHWIEISPGDSGIHVLNKKMHFIWVSMYLARKHLLGTLYFYISYWRWDRHFTLSSEPCKGPAICKAKAVPPFLSHFKTLSVGPIPGIEPTTSRAAVKHSTDWANPAAVKTTIPSYHYYWYLCSVPVHLDSWTPTKKWEEVWRVIDVCLQTQNASSVTTSSWSLNCGEIARYLTSSLNLFICATIRREEKSLRHIAMVAKFAWQ